MAEDILQLMGMKEGLNYEKQVTIEGVGSRPDFGFFLPGGLRLNMDVRVRSIQSHDEPAKQSEKSTGPHF